MLPDVCRCQQMLAEAENSSQLIYIRIPETWALSVAGASLDSLRGTYRGEQQFGEYYGVFIPCARVFSGYIPGYPTFRFPADTALLQTTQPAAARVEPADTAITKREFRRQLGISYGL